MEMRGKERRQRCCVALAMGRCRRNVGWLSRTVLGKVVHLEWKGDVWLHSAFGLGLWFIVDWNRSLGKGDIMNERKLLQSSCSLSNAMQSPMYTVPSICSSLQASRKQTSVSRIIIIAHSHKPSRETRRSILLPHSNEKPSNFPFEAR